MVILVRENRRVSFFQWPSNGPHGGSSFRKNVESLRTTHQRCEPASRVGPSPQICKNVIGKAYHPSTSLRFSCYMIGCEVCLILYHLLKLTLIITHRRSTPNESWSIVQTARAKSANPGQQTPSPNKSNAIQRTPS